MPTSIRPCTCQHSAQNTIYGKGLRLHNEAPKKNGWVCTVCGHLKPHTKPQPIQSEEGEKEKKKNERKTKG